MQSRKALSKALIAAVCCVVLILLARPLVAQTFTEKQVTSGGGFGIKTADVNKDGKLDLILIHRVDEGFSPDCAGNPDGTGSADLLVHLGNGDGTFGPPMVFHS